MPLSSEAVYWVVAWGIIYGSLDDDEYHPLLGCSGDIVNRLSNWPYEASCGSLWGLVGDARSTY